MHEGNMYSILLWSWFKVRCESASKLDPLRRIYRENIWSLKLKSGGLLVHYIDRLQGLEIIWREIYKSSKPEYQLVTQMVKQIEDPIFSGLCNIIKNWDETKRTFRYAAPTLRVHEVSKMTAQTKRAIDNEINILLLGKVSNNRRSTREAKILRAFNLNIHED